MHAYRKTIIGITPLKAAGNLPNQYFIEQNSYESSFSVKILVSFRNCVIYTSFHLLGVRKDSLGEAGGPRKDNIQKHAHIPMSRTDLKPQSQCRNGLRPRETGTGKPLRSAFAGIKVKHSVLTSMI
jgi:hypothetical protein